MKVELLWYSPVSSADPVAGLGRAVVQLSAADGSGPSWDAAAAFSSVRATANKTACLRSPSQSQSGSITQSGSSSQSQSSSQSLTQSQSPSQLPTPSSTQSSSASQSTSGTSSPSQSQSRSQTLSQSPSCTQSGSQTTSGSSSPSQSGSSSGSPSQTQSQTATGHPNGLVWSNTGGDAAGTGGSFSIEPTAATSLSSTGFTGIVWTFPNADPVCGVGYFRFTSLTLALSSDSPSSASLLVALYRNSLVTGVPVGLPLVSYAEVRQ
jgi:hypothetical protein